MANREPTSFRKSPGRVGSGSKRVGIEDLERGM